MSSSSRWSMKGLQQHITDFQKENKQHIKHTYQIGGESGYYTLSKHTLDGSKQIEYISTSPKFTKRKDARAGSLNACYYAWRIMRYE